LGAIFAHIGWGLLRISRICEGLQRFCPNFHGFCADFKEFCPDFHQIKTFGCALAPPLPTPVTGRIAPNFILPFDRKGAMKTEADLKNLLLC